MKTTTTDYGTVVFNGRKIELTEMAEMSGRLLPDHLRNEGYVEWSARGYDSEGNRVDVLWVHLDDDRMPENYNWDDADEIVDLE